MEFRSVGGSGLRVSVAGLGCNNFGGRIDEKETNAVVSAALPWTVTVEVEPIRDHDEPLGVDVVAIRQDLRLPM